MSDSSLPDLIRAAIDAAVRAYVPYSHYPVGAALLTTDGQIYAGCNIENASYPASICGERVALVKAVSEGHHTFTHLVVATRDGGSPCGVCRQMLNEFAPDLPIVMVRLDGEIVARATLREYLANGFGPANVQPAGS